MASTQEAAAFRARHGIDADAPLILVLPGSRRSEVDRLAPVFGEALRPVLRAHPDARLVLPTTESVAPMLAEKLKDWPAEPLILDPRGKAAEGYLAEKRAAFAAADVALAASGTVSLELAAAGTPMVVAYDMSWLSRKIIGALLKVDTGDTGQPGLRHARPVPEFLGPDCRPEPIARALRDLLSDEAARRAQTRTAMDATMLSARARWGAAGDKGRPVRAAGDLRGRKSRLFRFGFAGKSGRSDCEIRALRSGQAQKVARGDGKTCLGVPAAAQILSNSIRRGSNQARTGLRWPTGATPPIHEARLRPDQRGVGLAQWLSRQCACLRRVDAVGRRR